MMCTVCLSFLVSVCYADDNDQEVQGAYKTSPEAYHTTKVEVSLSRCGQRRYHDRGDEDLVSVPDPWYLLRLIRSH
jgi:hypothetical protein